MMLDNKSRPTGGASVIMREKNSSTYKTEMRTTPRDATMPRVVVRLFDSIVDVTLYLV